MKTIHLISILLVMFCQMASAQVLDIGALTEKAEQGDVEAIELLGECYYNGTGMDKKYYSKAIPYLKKAAEKGSSKSMFYLYQCYNFGRGVSENESEATSWLRKAAIGGHEAAFEHYIERFPDEKDEMERLKEQWKKEQLYKVEVTSDNNIVFTIKGVSFTMIHVPGGTFTMGATSEQGKDAWNEENPPHNETVSSYYIGQSEVTQELWQAVMEINPSFFQRPKHPVEQVSWNDCQKFINKLNTLTGKKFRLPTEVEWEYAARGGKSFGTKFSGSENVNDVAWYLDNSSSSTHRVKTRLPNNLFIYDMSGNVQEWTSDFWCDNYNKSRKGPYRVVRGGSWNDGDRAQRVSCRTFLLPTSYYTYLGFRLAL